MAEWLMGEVWSAVRSVTGATIIAAIGTVLFGFLPRTWRTWYRGHENSVAAAVLGAVATLGLGSGIAVIVAGDRFAATPKDADLGGALMIVLALSVLYFAWRAYAARRGSSVG